MIIYQNLWFIVISEAANSATRITLIDFYEVLIQISSSHQCGLDIVQLNVILSTKDKWTDALNNFTVKSNLDHMNLFRINLIIILGKNN